MIVWERDESVDVEAAHRSIPLLFFSPFFFGGVSASKASLCRKGQHKRDGKGTVHTMGEDEDVHCLGLL